MSFLSMRPGVLSQVGHKPPDMSAVSYDNKSTASTTSAPQGLAFKPDGTKMYVLGDNLGNDNLFQHTLSTPWDVSTSSYDDVAFPALDQDIGQTGIAFKDDGSKMYICGVANNAVYQYTLSTPWDLSTASYDGVSASVGAQDTDVSGLAFKDDGSKIYICGDSTNAVYQYTVTTPWDLSNVSYDGVSASVGAQDTGVRGHTFKPDGRKMYVLGNDNDSVFQYSC